MHETLINTNSQTSFLYKSDAGFLKDQARPVMSIILVKITMTANM
jgi:hypothetical protein